MLARILLFIAILEVAPLIKASATSGVLGTNCKIRSKAFPGEYLKQLPKDQSGLAATAPLSSSPLNSKWRIERVTVDNNNYYEIFNRQFETYLVNYYYSEMWAVAGVKNNFAASNKRDTLWVIEPALYSTDVAIKHVVTGSYLTTPRGAFAQRHALLSADATGDESRWQILC